MAAVLVTQCVDPSATPIHGAPINHPSAWKVADFKSPAEAPRIRKVHPHVHLFEDGVGMEAVSGRTPSFDWRPLTSDRIDHGVTAPPYAE